MTAKVWHIIVAIVILVVRVSAEVIDADATLGIESIASSLCHSSTPNIGRASTIGKLVEYLDSHALEPRLASCYEQYIQPLKELKIVLDAGSTNACGKKAIDQINNFHWSYIVSNLSKKWRKVSGNKIPEPLKVFFMHYSNEVAEQCKLTLSQRLEAATTGQDFKAEALYTNKLATPVDKLSLVLVDKEKVKSYDNFLLLWNQVSMREKLQGEFYEQILDTITGESIMSLVKVKDPSNIWSAQRKCRHDLRPIYQDTVLPLMRLIEMGYGRVKKESSQIDGDSKLITNWYAIAQFCELMLPMGFLQDDSMKEHEALILLSPRETEGLTRSADDVHVNNLPSNANIESVKMEDSLKEAGESGIVKQVKSNLKSRGSLFRHFFKNILSNLKSDTKSKIKSFLTRRLRGNRYDVGNSEDLIKYSEAKLGEMTRDDDHDVDDGESLHTQHRVKRGDDGVKESKDTEEKVVGEGGESIHHDGAKASEDTEEKVVGENGKSIHHEGVKESKDSEKKAVGKDGKSIVGDDESDDDEGDYVNGYYLDIKKGEKKLKKDKRKYRILNVVVTIMITLLWMAIAAGFIAVLITVFG